MRDRDMSPQTESLLRRARQAPPISPRQRRSLKGAVLARIALVSTGFAMGHSVLAGMGAVAKGVAGVALVASIGVGGFHAYRSRTAASWEHTAAGHEQRPIRAAAPEAQPALVSDRLPGEAARVAPPVRRNPRLAHVAPRAQAAVVTPARAAASLGDETALLRNADRALRAGDRRAALALLDEHARRFPAGTLAPERTAEQLILSCETGHVDEKAVSVFLGAHPSSPLGERVKRACVGE